MAHTVLSVVAEVQPDSIVTLRQRIAAFAAAVDEEGRPLTARLSKLHFMSLSVFDDPHYDPLLVFENNFDGSPKAHWEEISKALGSWLRPIFACCKVAREPQFAPLFQADATETLAPFLAAHTVPPAAFHIGNPGMTVDRIQRERVLAAAVRSELDGDIAHFRELPPSGIHAELRKRLLPTFDWLDRQESRVTRLQRLGIWIDALVNFLLPVLLVWIGIPVLLGCLGLHWLAAVALVVLPPALIAIAIRRLETTDFVEEKPDPNNATMDAIARRENQRGVAQNHLASVVMVKPGMVRGLVIRLGVAALKHGVRLLATDGYLGPMRTIHFAHWALVGNTGRLLFLSNYDGSWESYLDDFIDKAHAGLTLAWSNCVGFPRTEWLVKDGATNGPLFKAWARQSQRESLFWYSAYPDLTVNQVERNFAVATGLRQASLDGMEAETWARQL